MRLEKVHEKPGTPQICARRAPHQQFSKKRTGNYPKCAAPVTVVAGGRMSWTKADRALFLFFFQRLVTGAATSGGEINTRVKTGDHDATQRAMRLGFHGYLRWRRTFAALWLGNARRRDFGDGFACSHEVKTDLLFAAGRGRLPKSGLRFGHLVTSIAACVGQRHRIVAKLGSLAAGRLSAPVCSLERTLLEGKCGRLPSNGIPEKRIGYHDTVSWD
jgi:hypothetical protein